MKRSQLQIDANKFDCDIYRLIDRAAQYAESNRVGSVQWRQVTAELRHARRVIRNMMHKDDRKETIGG